MVRFGLLALGLAAAPQGSLSGLARAQTPSMQAVPANSPPPLGNEPSASVLPGGLQLTLSSDNPQVAVRRIIDTRTQVDLWRLTIRSEVDSESFCPSQCLRWLSASERQSRFLVTGVPGVEFSLPAEGSAATVHIRAGDALKRAGGFVMLIAGGLVATGGMSLTFAGEPDAGRRYGLGVPLVVGGLLLVAGSIPIVLRYRTRVRIESTAVRP